MEKSLNEMTESELVKYFRSHLDHDTFPTFISWRDTHRQQWHDALVLGRRDKKRYNFAIIESWCNEVKRKPRGPKKEKNNFDGDALLATVDLVLYPTWSSWRDAHLEGWKLLRSKKNEATGNTYKQDIVNSWPKKYKRNTLNFTKDELLRKLKEVEYDRQDFSALFNSNVFIYMKRNGWFKEIQSMFVKRINSEKYGEEARKNLGKAGAKSKGKITSEITKEKLRIANIGKQKGRKIPEERKERISVGLSKSWSDRDENNRRKPYVPVI